MNHQLRLWRRAVARVLVLALIATLAPVYCLAGEPPGPPQSAPTQSGSIRKSLESEAIKAANAPVVSARQAGSEPGADRSSASFFKTRTGVITLLVVGAGLGYALYSTSNDRVKSPNRVYGEAR